MDHSAEVQEKGYTKIERVLSKDAVQDLLRADLKGPSPNSLFPNSGGATPARVMLCR